MTVHSKRIVEIPTNSMVPKPYVIHNAEGEMYELDINIEFHDVHEFFNALRDVYFLYQQKGNSYEDNLDAFIFQHYDFARQVRSGTFDTTRVKKLSEKRLLPNEF